MNDTQRPSIDAEVTNTDKEDTRRKVAKVVDPGRNDACMDSVKRADSGMVDVRMKNGTNRADSKREVVGVMGANRTDSEMINTGVNRAKGTNSGENHVKSDQGYLCPETDPRFHDTYKFLRRYRDATYSLKVVVRQMEFQFRMQYGTSVDDFLDSVYAAGVDLPGDDIAERAKSIERSNRMLKLLDSSVELLRNNHKHGEQYYWILYYTFLSPQELDGTNEIIEKLTPHIANISYRTYYRKRRQAIEALSTILWGFTAKESLDVLNKFFTEE